ncbi:MAG: tryptophan--tRNA ligase [Candidatus Saccharibacteria bacterium]
MSKPVILTGIRANNDLTIGNYFGALLPIIDMATTRADDYQINLFVPDLHSFTTPINHRDLHDQIMHNLRTFVAAGLPLDHNDIHIYRQSYVSAHSELTWILDCFTGFGEMNRMTQFKDKSGKLSEDRISMGLFNYPVLMAADILLYDALYIPVGEDQTQHLEFTRDVAERFNNKFVAEFPRGVFTVPLAVPKQHAFFGKDQGLRIKDLANPAKKMSKSDETGKGVIFLSDTPEAAAKKTMGATTDSLASIHYDKVNQPGIANLLDILALLTHKPVQEVASEWEGRERYGELKTVVADAVKQFLTGFQANLAAVDDQAILDKLAVSEKIMNTKANETLLKAQRAVGLRSLS